MSKKKPVEAEQSLRGFWARLKMLWAALRGRD